MQDEDFLDGLAPDQTAAPVQEPAPTPEPPTEAATGDNRPRGPDGKFLPKEAGAETPAPQPQTPAPTSEAVQPATVAEHAKPPEGFVPIGVVQELRKELQTFKQQAAQPPPPMPDPYEDFEAYQGWQEAQLTAERADWSRQLAEARHGADTVEQARAWAFERAEADPIFRQQSAMQRDPYGFAIEAWKRDQVLTRLSDPGLIDRFLAFAGGQAAPTLQNPAAPVAAIPQPPTPPRSLASVPSAGSYKPGEVPLDDESLFASAIR
jgi:hypothetical protein